MKTKEYRERLASEFASILEEQQLDWKKEWAALDVQINAVNKNMYKGNNRFYLSMIAMQRKYYDPRWATYKQIQDSGWRLKNAKGQGVTVEYWFPYDTEEKKAVSWEAVRKSDEQIGGRYQLRARYFTVFNASLIEGIEPYERPQKKIEADELVEKLSHNMNVEIRNDGGDRAFYSPLEDRVHLPLKESFYTEYAYNSTALHELTHATGAEHRLNRKIANSFASPEYAFEELVAEIGSCFMSTHLQIEQDERHIENHKAYVQSWIKSIRDEPEKLMQAIQLAEKATIYMEYQAELIPREEYLALSHNSVKVADQLVSATKTEEQRGIEVAYHINGEDYLYLSREDKDYTYIYSNSDFSISNNGIVSGNSDGIEQIRDTALKSEGIVSAVIEEIPIEEYKLLPDMLHQEPTVLIEFTESDQLEPDRKMTISEADELVKKIDQDTRIRYEMTGNYDKIQFRVEYMQNGRIRTYTGGQDLGKLDGSLTEHILKHATHYRNDPGYQKILAERGGNVQKNVNQMLEYTIYDFVPYLNMHKNLTAIEKAAGEKARNIEENTEIFDNLTIKNLEYYDALEEYVGECRKGINASGNHQLPELPQLQEYINAAFSDSRDSIQEETKFEQISAVHPIIEGDVGLNKYAEEMISETKDGIYQLKRENKFFRNIATIQEYEQSIKREQSIIKKLEEDKIPEYAEKCQKYLMFGQQVDNCLAGDIPMREALKVCETPTLMLQAGLNPLPMHITQKHLKDCMREKRDDHPHYHGLTVDEIKRIPEELENPAIIAQSPSRNDSVVLILGYRESSGLPIIVSVVPDGKATYNLQRVDSNFITSVYGKDRIQDYVQRLVEKKQLIYINKEKSEELALLPLQLRQDHPALAFDYIIKPVAEDVKKNAAVKNMQHKQIGRRLL